MCRDWDRDGSWETRLTLAISVSHSDTPQFDGICRNDTCYYTTTYKSTMSRYRSKVTCDGTVYKQDYQDLSLKVGEKADWKPTAGEGY